MFAAIPFGLFSDVSVVTPAAQEGSAPSAERAPEEPARNAVFGELLGNGLL